MGWNKPLPKEGHKITESQGRRAPSPCLHGHNSAWPQEVTDSSPWPQLQLHFSFIPSLPDRKLTCRNSEKKNGLEHRSTTTGRGSRAVLDQIGREEQIFSFPLMLRDKGGDVVFQCSLFSPSSPLPLTRTFIIRGEIAHQDYCSEKKKKKTIVVDLGTDSWQLTISYCPFLVTFSLFFFSWWCLQNIYIYIIYLLIILIFPKQWKATRITESIMNLWK